MLVLQWVSLCPLRCTSHALSSSKCHFPRSFVRYYHIAERPKGLTLHFVLLLETERLGCGQLEQLGRLHPFMVPLSSTSAV